MPAAFVSAGRASKGKLDLPLETSVRRASRDLFRKTSPPRSVDPDYRGGARGWQDERPEPPVDAEPVAFEDGESGGDAGHRS